MNIKKNWYLIIGVIATLPLLYYGSSLAAFRLWITIFAFKLILTPIYDNSVKNKIIDTIERTPRMVKWAIAIAMYILFALHAWGWYRALGYTIILAIVLTVLWHLPRNFKNRNYIIIKTKRRRRR